MEKRDGTQRFLFKKGEELDQGVRALKKKKKDEGGRGGGGWGWNSLMNYAMDSKTTKTKLFTFFTNCFKSGEYSNTVPSKATLS